MPWTPIEISYPDEFLRHLRVQRARSGPAMIIATYRRTERVCLQRVLQLRLRFTRVILPCRRLTKLAPQTVRTRVNIRALQRAIELQQ